MQTALLCDNYWLDQEQAQLKHLVVGMLDEQVQVVQVLPRNAAACQANLFGQTHHWHDTSWLKPCRRWMLGRLAPALKSHQISIIHALTRGCWSGAARLALKLDTPVVFNVNGAEDLPKAKKISPRLDAARVAWIAATEPLARRLRQILDEDAFVQTIRFGVHLPESSPTTLTDHVPCLVITGDGRVDNAYQNVLCALRQVISHHPQTQLFFDSPAHNLHRLWQATRKQQLSSHVNLVPRDLEHRQLLLRADVLIQPQALGVARSFTLSAMAHGTPVLTREDPWLDYLVDDQTAWLIEQPTPTHWADRLMRLLNEPTLRHQLGAQGRQWVHEQHIPAKQVQQTLAVYRRLLGETLKFPQKPTAS